ncbi:hypothetical protein KCP78_23645 [Salmonella enterica subsp. enterica]|nr:hypothetical protein KCP78_23645 [Salmonella enterica subsp. enterica]
MGWQVPSTPTSRPFQQENRHYRAASEFIPIPRRYPSPAPPELTESCINWHRASLTR